MYCCCIISDQGDGSADGPLGHPGRAEEQLFLRCGLRPGQDQHQHIRHHAEWLTVRVQRQEAARQMGGTQGKAKYQKVVLSMH